MLTAIATLVLFAATGTEAQARKESGKIFMPPVKKLSLAQVIHWQHRIIKHDRWVIDTAKSHTQEIVKFHRAQLRWVTKELHQNLKRRVVSSYRHIGKSVQSIICSVFGPYCSQAEAVASCESGFNTGAANGQYLGLFQMGESERVRYGHGSDAYSQAVAAYRYFRDSGYDWSPWSCKP